MTLCPVTTVSKMAEINFCDNVMHDSSVLWPPETWSVLFRYTANPAPGMNQQKLSGGFRMSREMWVMDG